MARVRRARPADVPVVLSLIRELAAYEREPDAVEATEAGLHEALFGAAPRVFGLVAEDDAGTVVGFALWFYNFSTWRGRHGIYLEDLYVRPGVRGSGHGRALLSALARIAVEEGCARLEWVVLDWNVDAQAFYQAVGAAPVAGWTTWRLTGDALERLGAPA